MGFGPRLPGLSVVRRDFQRRDERLVSDGPADGLVVAGRRAACAAHLLRFGWNKDQVEETG
jgi:hypothetical protein